MHERTQRGLSRLAFVACCAVPTFLTLVAIIVTWTPWYHRAQIRNHESRLSKITGLQVRVEDYETLSPSTVRLSQIVLTDPETEIEIASVRQVDWSVRNGRTSILVQQPELHAATFPAVWEMIHQRFLRRPEQMQQPVRMAASDLTIHSQRGTTITLRDVDAWIEPSTKRDAVHATVECLLAGSVDTSPISIAVTRQHHGGIPTTSWTLQTGTTTLPCSALEDCFRGWWGGLGPQATFQGTLKACLPNDSFVRSQQRIDQPGMEDSRPIQLDLSGSTFANVSLDRMFEKQRHRLSGMATVKLERCRLDRDQRLVDIAGSIRASDGLIGRSLLSAAVSHLNFAVQVPDDDQDVAFDRMAMHFSLLGSQLKLRGACRQEINHEHFPVDVVLGSAGAPIAFSSQKPVPSVRLMSVLAPSNSEWIPLSEQNQQLLWLLMPSKHGSLQANTSQVPINRNTDNPPAMPRIRSARRYDGTRPPISQPSDTQLR